MKKNILLTSFVFTACVIANCQKENTEDKIDLTGDIVSVPVAKGYVNYASTDILIPNLITTNKTSVVTMRDTLTITEISFLQNKATRAATVAGAAHYITAVEIKYGINKYSLDLYIRPLFVIQAGSVPNIPDTYYYTCTAREDSLANNPYYLIGTNGILGSADYTQNVTDEINYQTNIIINHYYGDQGNFNSLSYSPDDSTLIFSFQEISAVMSANLMVTGKQDTSIVLQSIGRPVPANIPATPTIPGGGWYPVIKHDILLVPAFYESNPHSHLFPANKMADLANMCPPECPATGIIYTLRTN